MDVGIGLPCSFRGVTRDLVVEWARRAEAGPFSSLSAGERIAFPNHDLLTTLALTAGVTERIRLMTTVLVLPLHQPGILTKQIATLDALSGGRLSVGVGSGVAGRLDDYAATQLDYAERGPRFELQLELLEGLRAGRSPAVGVEPIPLARPGGPELLIGGASPRALRRAARSADGVVTFGVEADPLEQSGRFEIALEAWRAAGRTGRPRFVAGVYFALGDRALERADEHLGPYYASLGPEARSWMINAISVTSPAAVRETVARFAEAGVDELYFTPAIPDVTQLEALADAL